MSLAFIIHVILYALIGLYISMFFLMLLIFNRDVRTIYGNIIIKSIIIISIALTWYYIPLLWLTPHSCFNEYRGIEHGKEKHVEYNFIKSDSTYVYTPLPDTITGVIEVRYVDNRIHNTVVCEDGYEFYDDKFKDFTEKQRKNTKVKVVIKYYPKKKYTVIK